MNDFKNIAKLAKTKNETERLFGKVSTRPLKIAFLIDTSITLSNFTKILEYNSIVWGGYYNALIPVKKEKIEDDWWESLKQHNSDVVVYCSDVNEDIPEELAKRLHNTLDPFFYTSWVNWGKDPIEWQKQGREDFARNLPLWSKLSDIHQTHRPVNPGNSNVRYPKSEVGTKYYPYIIAHVGSVPSFYKDTYKDVFKAEPISFKSNDLSSYIKGLGEFDGRLTPIKVTIHDLGRRENIAFHERNEGLSLILVGNDFVSDFCLFWIFRLVPQFLGMGKSYKELLIPINELKTKKNVSAFTSRLKENDLWKAHHITIYSQSVSEKRIEKLIERLKPEFEKDTKFKIAKKKPPIASLRTYESEEGTEIHIENGRFNLKRPLPSFSEKIKNGNWVVDLELRDSNNRVYSFPDSTGLNHLLCGSPPDRFLQFGGHWIRQTPNRLSFKASLTQDYIPGELVSPLAAYEAVFEDYGFLIKLNEKSAYTKGLHGLLSSQGHLKLFENEGVRQLLWQMSTKDKAHFTSDMKQMLGRSHNKDEILNKLLNSRIILRGLEFECGVCALRRWYPLNEVDETMQCMGCLNEIRPPLLADVKFKLNELASRAIKQGSLPLIVLDKLLKDHSFHHNSSLYNINITKNDTENEIDYLTEVDGGRIIAECKELKRGVNDKQIREIIAQLRTQVALAKKIEADAVLLGTFLDRIPDDLAQKTMKLSAKGVAVQIISLKEKKIVDLNNPDKYKDFSKWDLFTPFSPAA